MRVREDGEGCVQRARKATVRAFSISPPPITTAPLSSELSKEWLPPISPAKSLLCITRHRDQGKRRLLISVTVGNFFSVAF